MAGLGSRWSTTRTNAATEPRAAGPDAPHMYGTFCNPVMEFQHSGYHTLIFDLATAPGSVARMQ